MLGKKTVASITKGFNKVVLDLDVLINEKQKESSKLQDQIVELKAKQKENAIECTQANTIKANIEKLLS